MISILDTLKPLEDVESDYEYKGVIVPRVTRILQKCIHNDSLMYWANSLGFKHMSYRKTLNQAALIGTYCHNNIDKFMDDPEHSIDMALPTESQNAYNSFLKWYSDINSNSRVRVIYHEMTLACKYFGGTLDGLYKVNGKIYLIDYKTSNHVTYKYFLQLAAYRYMLKTELNCYIDGCIILQLSKHNVSYKEYVLNFNNPYHLQFMNECESTFLALVYSYYKITNIENMYGKIDWEDNTNGNGGIRADNKCTETV